MAPVTITPESYGVPQLYKIPALTRRSRVGIRQNLLDIEKRILGPQWNGDKINASMPVYNLMRVKKGSSHSYLGRRLCTSSIGERPR